MAWPERLGSFLFCFSLNLVICCTLAGAHDVKERDVVGSFMSLNGQGYRGRTSKTSASKDEVVLGKIILGSSAKDWKGDNGHGRGLSVKSLDTDGYQSDADWSNLKHLQGEVYGPNSWSPAVQALLDMEPSVQCGDNFMTLQLKGTLLGSSLLVDGGDGSLLPLSQLPSKCGYSVKMTWHDVVFKAPYNGCYNTKEGSNYVLSLRWLGTPMKMACPHRPSTAPASVACYSSGMVVKIDAPQAVASKLNIKFKNKWKPLLWVSAQCGYGVITHPGGLVITAPFTPCDETKDGMHTIEILEGKIKLSCPSPAANVPSDYFLFKPETPVPAAAGPWPPCFMYPQPPKPVPAAAGPWPPCFMYPQPPKPVPATAAPAYPQPPKPVPAAAGPKHAPAYPQAQKPVPAAAPVYLKPESRTGDTLPSWNYPIPPWAVYPQTIPATTSLNPGPQRFAHPYIPRPSSAHSYSAYTWPSMYTQSFQPAAVTPTQAGYPHSPNCWPFSHNWHSHLHLASDSNLAEYAPVSAPAREPHHAPRPYPRQCNLPYTWSSSSRPAIQLAAPALPPQASHDVKRYWDLVPFSSSQ